MASFSHLRKIIFEICFNFILGDFQVVVYQSFDVLDLNILTNKLVITRQIHAVAQKQLIHADRMMKEAACMLQCHLVSLCQQLFAEHEVRMQNLLFLS